MVGTPWSDTPPPPLPRYSFLRNAAEASGLVVPGAKEEGAEGEGRERTISSSSSYLGGDNHVSGSSDRSRLERSSLPPCTGDCGLTGATYGSAVFFSAGGGILAADMPLMLLESLGFFPTPKDSLNGFAGEGGAASTWGGSATTSGSSVGDGRGSATGTWRLRRARLRVSFGGSADLARLEESEAKGIASFDDDTEDEGFNDADANGGGD